MNIPETEQIYRVMFEGVLSPDDPALSNAGKKITTDVSVNLVWGILVTVPPRNPQISTSLTKYHKKLKNKGNRRIKIIDVGLCHQGKPETARQWKTDNINLFPERQYHLPLIKNQDKIIIKYKSWLEKTKPTSF